MPLEFSVRLLADFDQAEYFPTFLYSPNLNLVLKNASCLFLKIDTCVTYPINKVSVERKTRFLRCFQSDASSSLSIARLGNIKINWEINEHTDALLDRWVTVN